ncbi:2-hydroxyacyl-CoA lyase-like protein [Drosera capensis]
MGKGLISDRHELAATAARSLAIGKCDVVLVVGARLNCLLHFGEPPKWEKDVKFILVDVSEEEIELRKPFIGLVEDAKKVVGLINREIKDDPFCLGRSHPWVDAISKKAKDTVSKMEAQLAKDVVSFNFFTPMRIIRDAIIGVGSPAPSVGLRGGNTMDVGLAILLQTEPRTRVDAGTWGTMEVENDPAPTSFVPEAGYHILIEAFGGKGYLVKDPDELKSALSESFSARKPAVINVIIDPYAGSESGRLQHKNWFSAVAAIQCCTLYGGTY